MAWTEQVKQLRPRFESLVRAYGPLAIGIYFSLYGVAVAISAATLYAKLRPQTWGSAVAMLGGIWLSTRATLIPRLALTVALTPVLARWFKLRTRTS